MGLFTGKGGGSARKGLFGGSTGGSAPADPTNPSIVLGVDPNAVASGTESYAGSRADSVKSAAQDLSRLMSAGKFDEAKALSKKYAAAFTKEEQEQLKLEIDAAKGPGLAGKAFQTADSATGGALSTGLQILDAPSQASLASMGNIKQAITGKDSYGNKTSRLGAVGRALGAAPVNPYSYMGGTDAAIEGGKLDVDQSGNITNLREALGKDPTAGGRLLGAFDTAGVIATDPTTYMTMGGANAARTAVKQTVIREVGESTWKKIATEGLDRGLRNGTISAAEHKAVQDAFRKQAEELAQSALAGKSSIASRISPAARTTRKLAEAGDIEGMVGRNMDVLSRQGRSGVKFGIGEQTRTIIPTRPGGLRIPGLQKEFDFAADAAKTFKPGQVLLSKTPLTVSGVDEAGDMVAELAGGPGRTEGSSLIPEGANAATTPNALDQIPEMTDEFDTEAAESFLQVADMMAPAGKDTVVHVNAQGTDQFILRNAEGKAAGFLSIADGKVEDLYVNKELAGPRQADRLYKAAEDAGHDISTLGADSMTPAGRKAREGYLSRSSSGGEMADFEKRMAALPKSELDGKPNPGMIDATLPPGDGLVRFVEEPGQAEALGQGKYMGNKVYGFREDGELKAFLTILDDPTYGQMVGSVWVDPALRGSGLSKKLYAAAADDGVDLAKLNAASISESGLGARRSAVRAQIEAKAHKVAKSAAKEGKRRNPGMENARTRLASLFPGGEIPAAKADQIYTEGEVLEGIGTVTKVTPDGVHIKPEAAPFERGAQAKVLKDSIGGAIGKSDVGTWVKAAFSPRAGVRSALGEGGERAVYAAEAGGEAALNANSRDLALRLKPVRKAAAALQSPPKALYEAVPVLEGLRGREAFTRLAEGLLDGSVDRAALQVLSDSQEATVLRGIDALQKLGVDTEATVLSMEGAKHADQLAEVLGVKADSLKPGRDITEVLREQWPTAANARTANKQLSEALQLPKDVKFFEEDIISQTALRSRAAFRGAVQSSMFEKLSKEVVDGNPLVKIITKDSVDNATPPGWVAMPGIDPSIGRVVGPPEVIHELSKVRDIIINDDALEGLNKFFNNWRRIWATGATSPLPWGTAFHARNATGNAFNAFLAGMTNPLRFKEAQGLQRQAGKVARAMKKTGDSWDDAAAKILSPADLEALSAMRADGTISSGFFHDMDSAFLEQIDPKQGAAASVFRQAKLVDSGPAKAGRKLGDVVENNARIALWLDTYAKTGSKTQAAERVKKYLFDYSDLTAVDRQLKKVMPFWTFTKKNLALQMETLAKDPWRVKNMTKVEGMLFGGDDEDAPLPEWAGKSGYRTTSVLGGGKEGTLGLAANIETPLDAALHTLDPIVQAATLVPGLRDHVPPEYRSDGSEVSRALFGMGGGGPVEFVTFLVENSTGKDMFTGGAVKEGSTFERFTNVIAPVWGKQRGLSGQVTGGSKPGMTRRLDLLKSFTGINILPLTEKERAQVAFAAKTELQEAIKALEESGEDIPTYSELESAGLVPDLRTLEEENERLAEEQAKLTGPQVSGKEQTLTEINAIRALNGQPPLIGGSTGAEKGGRRGLFG